MMDEEGWTAHSELCRELHWLEANHPEKARLIAVARGHVDTIRMAGSCESFCTPTLGTLRTSGSLYPPGCLAGGVTCDAVTDSKNFEALIQGASHPNSRDSAGPDS